MKHGRIVLQTDGDVVVMTLNDPGVLNAFGQKLREDMTESREWSCPPHTRSVKMWRGWQGAHRERAMMAQWGSQEHGKICGCREQTSANDPNEEEEGGQREADWVYEARPVFTCMMMTVVTPAPTPACPCQSAPHM